MNIYKKWNYYSEYGESPIDSLLKNSIRIANQATNNINLNKTEVKNMEKLYQVYVIDKKKNFIVNGEVVVAKDEEDAKFELEVSEKVRTKKLKLSDVTIIIKYLGAVSVEEENKQ